MGAFNPLNGRTSLSTKSQKKTKNIAFMILASLMICFFAISSGHYVWLSHLMKTNVHYDKKSSYSSYFKDALTYNKKRISDGGSSLSFMEPMVLPGIVKAHGRREDYNFTVGICCIVKDVEPYLEEWLDYQLGVLEVDFIALYDNSDLFVLQDWYHSTRDHPFYSKVKVIHHPGLAGGRVQRHVYTHCFENFGKVRGNDNPTTMKTATTTTTNHNNDNSNSSSSSLHGHDGRHDYLMIIDIDEFLVLHQHKALKSMDAKKHLGYVHPTNHTIDRIHDLIDDVWIQPPERNGRGSMLFHWTLVGYSNKTFYTPLPVLKRFQYRVTKKASLVVKPIVYTPDFSGMLNPHAVSLHKPRSLPPEFKRQVQYWAMDVVHTDRPALTSPSKASLHRHTLDQLPSIFRPTSSNTTTLTEEKIDELGMAPYMGVASLYHLRYTSLEEYRIKRCVRKEVNALVKGCQRSHPSKQPQLYLRREDDPNPIPDHNYPMAGDVLDDAPWRLLTWKVPKYRMYDTLVAFEQSSSSNTKKDDHFPFNQESSLNKIVTPAFDDFHRMSSF